MSDSRIEITKTRHIGKGALLGSFSFYDKSRDIYVNECCLFQNKQGERFVAFPQRSWQKDDGEWVKMPIFLFGKETSSGMKEEIFQALEAHRASNHLSEDLKEKNPQYNSKPTNQFNEENLPF